MKYFSKLEINGHLEQRLFLGDGENFMRAKKLLNSIRSIFHNFSIEGLEQKFAHLQSAARPEILISPVL